MRDPKKHLITNRRWCKRHPERVKMVRRKSYLKTTYGLSLEQFQQMLHEQNNVCKLCRKKVAWKKRNGSFVIDHEHKSGRIRGLLCNSCNVMIGQLEKIGLEKISKYLKDGKKR